MSCLQRVVADLQNDNFQEVKCKDDGKTLFYKDGSDILIQCKRCKENGKSQLRRIPIETILKSEEKIIKI